MSLIHNERTKLTATYLNGMAIALFAIGAVAPLVNVLNNGTKGGFALGLLATVCIALSGALHLVARYVLRSLKP